MYLKIKGRWFYLHRAIDRDGSLVGTMLSKKRAMKAAKRFFNTAKKTAGVKTNRVTTDHRGSYPRAIKEPLGKSVLHRAKLKKSNFD